jgi:hypothetical protein
MIRRRYFLKKEILDESQMKSGQGGITLQITDWLEAQLYLKWKKDQESLGRAELKNLL